MSVRDQLQALGFLNLDDRDEDFLNHVGADGYINKLMDAYEDEHICLPDMTPATIASLGISDPVANAISHAWEQVFAVTQTLVHGPLDYLSFVQNYFLDKLPTSECPLPDTIVLPRASGSVHHISVADQQQPVYVLHVSTDQWSTGRLESFQPLVDTLAGNFPTVQYEVLYHGTSRSHCADIIARGVTPSRGRTQQDFSNRFHRGYYCAYVLAHAVRWVIHCHSDQPAIVVHAVPKDQFQQQLAITDFGNEGTANWAQLVSACRRDDRFPPGFAVPDGIHGPVCGNPDAVKRNTQPPNPRRDSSGVMTQFCTLSDACASLLTRHIVGIVFVTPAIPVVAPSLTEQDFPPLGAAAAAAAVSANRLLLLLRSHLGHY
jgi:hypothetical protein